MKSRPVLPYFIMGCAILLVYGWTLGFSFLYYDDHTNIFENQPLLSGQVLYFWKHAHEGLYIPMVYTFWAGLFKVFGLRPVVFHAAGLIFHFANTVLVYFIIEKFRISKWPALTGALLFALHPVQVESVVWVSGLKDTSYAFFSLLSIWIFIFYSGSNAKRWLLGFLAVITAMLCKPTAVVLPVFIIAYLYFAFAGDFRHRTARVLRQVGPLPFSLLLGYFSFTISKAAQEWSQHPKAVTALFERPLIFLDSMGFYVTKILVPLNLYVDYARYPRRVLDSGDYYFYSLVAVTVLCYCFYWLKFKDKKKTMPVIFSGLLALVFFIPTSGIVTFGHQSISTTADRYLYLVMAGAAVFMAWLVERLNSLRGRNVLRNFWIGLILIMGALSVKQLLTWRNLSEFTLHLYEGNPDNYYANRNLGLFYQLKGEDGKALELFQKAQDIDPDKLSAKAAIASLYFNKRDYEKMDQFVEKYLSDEQLSRLQQTPYETHAFLMAVAESFIDRKNGAQAVRYLCKARSLGVQQLAAEVDARLEAVKKEGAEVPPDCVH